MRINTLMIPPPNDPNRAAESAAWACPFWVRGYPSKLVTREDGTPGVRRSTAGMAPPKYPPPKYPSSRDRAMSG